MKAKVISLCVGMPKDVFSNGRLVETGIFKTPVTGKVKLSKLNLEGDQQADLTVHGGVDKAVYAYPSEHYPWWRQQMPDVEFEYGKFGENLTLEGILEDDVCIGDEFQIGTTIVKVSQPRLPCYKLGIRFGRADIIKAFMQSARSGIYFSVAKEGEMQVGDEVKFLGGDEHHINLRQVANLFADSKSRDADFIHRALKSNLADQMKMFLSAEVHHL